MKIPILLLVAAGAVQAAEPKFEAQVLSGNITIGYGVAVGDVDGDKKPDILIADKTEFAWYRNPDWKRHVMVKGLTERDNVCLAARDIDGDGKVEVAVGGQWNPGETSDEAKSGSVHYLLRPADPTQLWKAVQLPHEPTVHRMRWVRDATGVHQLVVLPLHGRGNKGGRGEHAVKVQAYTPPANPAKAADWKIRTLHQQLHMTHNFESTLMGGKGEDLFVAGFEGILQSSLDPDNKPVLIINRDNAPFRGAGEVRVGPRRQGKPGLTLCAIESMHGNEVVVYDQRDGKWQRQVLDSGLNQGHALACADFTGSGNEQVVAGWRNPDKHKKVGIKWYARDGEGWKSGLVDDNTMACEDLKVADLNGDGKPDIVAAGRRSHNLVIYWNRSK